MSAPIVNKRNLDRYIGQRVRLFGKYSAAANTDTHGGSLNILTTDGIELKCRLGQGVSRPAYTGSSIPRVVCVVGRVEADGSITLDAPVADLGTDMDMNLMDEAINLQFRKEFAHLFYAPGSQASYA
jgi:hypothetical protein